MLLLTMGGSGGLNGLGRSVVQPFRPPALPPTLTSADIPVMLTTAVRQLIHRIFFARCHAVLATGTGRGDAVTSHLQATGIVVIHDGGQSVGR
jgi:hypothetical protein